MSFASNINSSYRRGIQTLLLLHDDNFHNQDTYTKTKLHKFDSKLPFGTLGVHSLFDYMCEGDFAFPSVLETYDSSAAVEKS